MKNVNVFNLISCIHECFRYNADDFNSDEKMLSKINFHKEKSLW